MMIYLDRRIKIEEVKEKKKKKK